MGKTKDTKKKEKVEVFHPKTKPRKFHRPNNNHNKKRTGKKFDGPAPISKDLLDKYKRGDDMKLKRFRSGREIGQLATKEAIIQAAAERAARAELLLTEDKGFLEADEPGDETFRVTQKQILAETDIQTATKRFNLDLPRLGPYRSRYSRDGQRLLLAGKLGHTAAMEWGSKKLLCEFSTQETVEDCCWLHTPNMFALAQRQWLHVYDNTGVELHCVKEISRPLRLDFLPYHFLLTATSDRGWLSWLDISVGKIVAQAHPKCGSIPVLTHNPANAIVLTGHANGSVSLWAPSSPDPLVKMLCHPGHQVTALTVDRLGRHLVTAGNDQRIKVWDLRTYKELSINRLSSAAFSLDISHSGLVAAGRQSIVEIFKDYSTNMTSYLRYPLGGYTTIADLHFANFEDVLGIGHSAGFSSILVPGAGEPNFDALEANPYMTKKQRQEMEVKALLNKIQPELISLDTSLLGKVDHKSVAEKWEERKKFLVNQPKKSKPRKPVSILDAKPKKPRKPRLDD